jgi:glyoxylase-like metal-dependent hydrolase (beta-lactamase superfamily II)
MKLSTINTGHFKLDGGAMFGVVPKALWQKVYPADENNMIPLAMRCLLIEDGDRKILIDNGIGEKQSEKFFSHYYLHGKDSLQGSLEELGLKPDDITDVLLTHLHFDHCGGSLKKNDDGRIVSAFPNAAFWVSEAQWNWANKPNRREKASFLDENISPLAHAGQLQLFRGDEILFPGVEVRIFDGHTGGQAIPIIDLGDRKLAYMADVIPTSAHIPVPWVMAYDTRPLLSLEERERFLNEALRSNYILFFEHDWQHAAGTLEDSEKGIRASKLGALENFI